MAQRNWQRTGTSYRVEWGGRPWELRVDGTSPGLRPCGAGSGGEFLCLRGIAATGRRGLGALGEASLLGSEQFRSRVEATYAPAGWGDLRVRACWCPSEDDAGMDLEVQVLASSVGDLKSLEVYEETVTDLDPSAAIRSALAWVIEARDRRSAGLSYDGREDDELLAAATTLPVPAPGVPISRPRVVSGPDPISGRSYLEFVHPDDVSRRIVETSQAGQEAGPVGRLRHALLGHDLEKGVVIRGRLRGLWMAADVVEQQLGESYSRFLDAPLPLGI
ncbi:hypothetical protein [Aquisphaera insulae]|uniref:hypothetical protein n=1 Tax=Aquisphaera insulae TaxID=2712864 RepID=UPI0013ED2642|nr:hypothetical protein [Aquisphaera insulae]